MDDRSWRRGSRDWAQDLGIATLAGLILASMGPFGTYLAGPVETRIAYWVGLFWCSLLFYSPAISGARWLAARLQIPHAVALGAGFVLAAIPTSALTSFAATRVWGVEASELTWYFQVLVVSVPMAAVQLLLHHRQPVQSAHKAISPQTPRLFARSSKLHGKLYCLEMQDHYVSVHSSSGRDLLLLRLRDAIEEADGVEGLQVHRSWWVARSAVSRVSREGPRLMLRLENGIEVPVSRSGIARLRAAGWLDQFQQCELAGRRGVSQRNQPDF
jgi:hypothetical protein